MIVMTVRLYGHHYITRLQ